jgi:hypothetical protein
MKLMKKTLIGLSALLILNPFSSVKAQQQESELETNMCYNLYSNCAKAAQRNGHNDKIVQGVGLACVSIYNNGLIDIRNGSIQMPPWRGRKPNDIKTDIMSAVVDALVNDKNRSTTLAGKVLFKYLGKEQYQEKLALSTFAVAETIVQQDLGISK